MAEKQQLEQAVEAAKKALDDFNRDVYLVARAEYNRLQGELNRARESWLFYNRRREQQAFLADLQQRAGNDLLSMIAAGRGQMWEFDYFSKTKQPLHTLEYLRLELEFCGMGDLSYKQLCQAANDLLGFEARLASFTGNISRFDLSDFGQIKAALAKGAVLPKTILVIYKSANRAYRRKLDEIMVYDRKDGNS